MQLRFEGVDAPELHYGTAAQPLGRDARDQLLAWIGFTGLAFAPPAGTRVTAATPDAIGAVVLSQAAEVNGRPVVYVVAGDGGELPVDGAWSLVTGHCWTAPSTPGRCGRGWAT